ncbi:MAG: acyltransferase [Kiritimatiellae bacterium]|nr:acyltransferase [Kiritimatiellia bacterium]
MDESLKRNPRHQGLDLARIVFMFLIVLRHGAFQSGATTQGMALKVNYLLGVAINDLTAVAVNGFVLISSYFLCQQEFRSVRLVRLWASVLFYSLGVLMVAWVSGFPVTARMVVGSCLPIVTGTYWFISEYFLLVALSPVLNVALNQLSFRQYRALMVVLLLAYSVLPSLGLDTFSSGHGYSIGWFIVLYVTAVYLRRFRGSPAMGRSLAGYAVATMATFVWLGAKFVLKQRGVELVPPDCYDFLPTFLASVCLFRFFSAVDLRSRVICRLVGVLAPLTLGVYLFHDHVLKHALWRDLLGIDRFADSPLWALRVLGCVGVVYVAGSVVEAIRRWIFIKAERRLGV